MILACFSYVIIKVLNIIWLINPSYTNLTIADMKPTPSFKKITVEAICLLFILLFVYAAASKLNDFESFRIQLGQSPVLGAYAEVLAIAVPVAEIIISVLLCIKTARLLGLYLSLGIMTMFSLYIVIILNWSFFIPCSCGGILEKLGWTEHLIFNVVFVLLAVAALLLLRPTGPAVRTAILEHTLRTKGTIALSLAATLLISSLAVSFLYIFSEDSIQRNNAFQRRYPVHPLIQLHDLDIKYDSYYIAGVSNSRIYLGNTMAPLHGMAVDTLLNRNENLRFTLTENSRKNYSTLRFDVIDSVFYLSDPTIPAIFKGTTGKWNAHEVPGTVPPFTALEPLGYNRAAIKTTDKVSGEDELAVLDFSGKGKIYRNNNLLTKQIDGLFDSDGMLLYNQKLKQIIYPYYYRNQYVVADHNAGLVAVNTTIDTIRKATIKITKNQSKKETTLSGIPVMVHKRAATSGGYLFIESDRLGKSEPRDKLREACIIDCYDLTSNTYAFSFYLYNFKGKKVKSFAVYHDLFITLTDHYIVTYRLNRKYFSYLSKK